VPHGDYVIRVYKTAQRRPEHPLLIADWTHGVLSRTSFSVLSSNLANEERRLDPPPADSTLFAAELISVEDTDLTVSIDLQPAPRLRGSALFEGARQEPSEADRLKVSITLDSVDGRVSESLPRGWLARDNTFETYGAPPGRYLIRVNGLPAGWTVKAASYSGHDLLTSPFNLGRDMDIRVMFTDKSSTLLGTVRSDAGDDASDAFVVVFPVDTSRWTDAGSSPRGFFLARATRKATYSIADVPEGDYFVAAVPASVARYWQAPATLQRVAAFASRVRIASGQTLTQALRLATSPR
jgi:hypothetical protein